MTKVNNKRIILILVLSLALIMISLAAGYTGSADAASSSADATSKTGVTVSATRDKINIKINKVGTSGKALVYAFPANEYPLRDTMSGLVTDNSTGVIVGKYNQGKTKTISISRYDSKGNDLLYYKYYVIGKDKKTIISGPYYATNIYAVSNSTVSFETKSKKGVTCEEKSTDAELAEDLGVSYSVVNIDITSLILPNEDAAGKKINQSKNDVIKFSSNGKTYYFSRSGVSTLDTRISQYSKQGINVIGIVIANATTDYNKYPKALTYTDQATYTMGFNTSNELGEGYWTAVMEFLAERYSRTAKQGLIQTYVIGNEIDYAYDWYQILDNTERDSKGKLLRSRAPFNTFMEEYARTLRLANLAVKKYNSNLQVCTSFTKCWAQRCYDAYGEDRDSKRWNSYAPKEILEWLSTYEKARGDYDWGIVTHPYGTDVSAHSPLVVDIRDSKLVTGNYKTSPIITVANLEILEQYLEKKANRYGNTIRSVYLTENGFNCPGNTTESMKYQCADMAQLYYRAASLDCVKAVALFCPTDNPTTIYNFGIMKTDGTRKLSYNVWKYIDTDKASQYVDKYLDYAELYKGGKIRTKANGYIKSWLDVMKVVDSGFKWDKIWDYDSLTPIKTKAKDNTQSLKVEGTSFGYGDPINITAEGNPTDIVGLFRSADDPLTDEPIYWYYVDGESNGLKHVSGRTYDIRVYGEVSSSRFDEATLPVGSYKIVLLKNSTDIIDSVDINITSSTDKDSPSIRTDKATYSAGEKILVTATGSTSCWAGLYGASDTPGKRTSIYWYYVNDGGSGKPSGATTVLQSTTHNTDSSNPGKVIKAGEYILYLFDESDGDSYNVVAQVPITVTSSDIQPLRSIKYVIDDPTSGLANGTVTVKKPSGADNLTDCIMYWADESGKPLEGYTSLAKFKLDSDETTVFEMYTHTIIPEGARKLIAYSTDGNSLSEEYVSCDLPYGCTYSLDGEVLSEFQIISDVHVTTTSGAINEVRYSNDHFKMMLEDVMTNSPMSSGIFINGDMANSGQAAEFNMIYKMYTEASKKGSLPLIHMSIGNHDWIKNNPNGQFQQYVNLFNPSIETDEVYYDEWVNGYHYIYLGGEEPGLRAVLSEKQLKWFDELMAEDTKNDPDRPVFVLLHQAMYNTCAGTLPGQNWDGVASETALRNILEKYGQIVMVGGHSHWELDSESCMYPGDDQAPVIFNTAAVGYLWTSYNIITGEYMEGSHGYYVKVYKDKIVFMGRDFVNNKFMPSAIFVVKKNKLDVETKTYDKTTDSAIFNLNAVHDNNVAVTYVSSDDSVATVDDDGNVTTQGTGTCHITCAVEGTSTTIVNRADVTINVTKGTSSWTRWTFDKTTATHTRAKKADSSVTQTKSCSHTKAKVLTKATLKKSGKIQYTCSKCGGTYTEVIPAVKSIKAETLTYTGKKQTPKLTITDANGDEIASKYYTVDKVKDAGVYKLKVKFKTRYSGSKTVEVTVSPKGTDVKSVSRAKTALTVKWNSVSSGDANGYEVSVTCVNDESDTTVKTVKGAKRKSVKISGLKSGVYYYVKIRTYKTVDGEKIHSDWSDELSAVTKS